MIMGTRIGVLLSGCGVYDGSEIQEAVLSLLEISRHGGTAVCMAPNAPQHHVVDHVTGEATSETRNTMVEAARIARGVIRDVASVSVDEIDALVMPGGFGVAKNLTSWAFDGPSGTIRDDVRSIILGMARAKKPLVGLCMAPTTIAKALEGSDIEAHLTVGTDQAPSPYEIAEIAQGMESVGARSHMNTIEEITVDVSNRIITAPCYMMEVSISEVHNNVREAIDALFMMLNEDHV